MSVQLWRSLSATFVLATACFLPLSAASFQSISFHTAKAKAAAEGKVLLMDFTASWCLPCQLMEETVFADPQVLAYLDEHYISVKVDIDDFDGFALKQQLQVEALPTLIFFSSEGKELGRIMQAIGTSRMLEELHLHNKPQNRKVQAQSTPAKSSREVHSSPTASEEIAGHPKYGTDDYKPPVTEPVTVVSDPGLEAENKQKVVTPQGVLAAQKAEPSEAEEVVASAQSTGIATNASEQLAGQAFQVRQQENSARYSLQVGVFSEQANAVHTADFLRSSTGQTVLIELSEIDGKVIYRVFLGRFVSLEEAMGFRQNLQSIGIQSIARELAMD